jgi:hypothetical protein
MLTLAARNQIELSRWLTPCVNCYVPEITLHARMERLECCC